MSGEGILIITDDQDRHAFFANKIIQSGMPVIGIITGAKRRQMVGEPINFAELPDDDADALRTVKRERIEAERFMFGGQAEKLAKDRGDIVVDQVTEADGTINAPRFVELIKQMAPAVIAVMGAAMLRAPLLETGAAFLNLHTGLSPYYRGGRTNMWPIIEGDYGHFGVTVHRIAPGIDDGEIYASRRVLVRPRDTYAGVNARAIKAGTAAMIDVIERLLDEPDHRGVDQWETGKLFYDRDYTPAVARTYLAKREWFMAEHLRRQARGELPELRLIA